MTISFASAGELHATKSNAMANEATLKILSPKHSHPPHFLSYLHHSLPTPTNHPPTLPLTFYPVSPPHTARFFIASCLNYTAPRDQANTKWLSLFHVLTPVYMYRLTRNKTGFIRCEKEAAGTMSEGRASLPSGMLLRIASLPPLGKHSVMRVSAVPGAMALAVIP